MRLPNSAHEAGPWRIHDLAPDFTLEDVWALPVYGGPFDFPRLLDTIAHLDPAQSTSLPARILWRVRDRLGTWFGLDTIPSANVSTLAERLPDDLRGTADEVGFGALPFIPLFLSANEFAAEVSNQTVHGVLHLAWARVDERSYQGQLAVYVRPRGVLGKGYLAFIRPFRHWVVYPALLGQIGHAWDRGAPR